MKKESKPDMQYPPHSISDDSHPRSEDVSCEAIESGKPLTTEERSPLRRVLLFYTRSTLIPQLRRNQVNRAEASLER
jgi:hypothetical protein